MNLELIVFLAGWGMLLFWLVTLGPSLVVMLPRTLPRRAKALAPPAEWPLVSMIIPARDEGKMIEAALRSVLAIDYPRLEIIAVNDRSRDETGRVMDRLAAGDARLRVIHIEQLPEGWLGKNHALHAAAEAAQGDFLLFTDGDVLFAPDALRLAITYAEHHRLDHLCLSPNLVPGSYLENALVSFMVLMFTLGFQPWLVPTKLRFFYAGVGAFNLVRHSAYRAIGGHVPIRLDVLDDVKLGKLIKNTKLRQDVLNANDRVRVKWQDNAWGVIRGMEKNGFSSVEYSLLRLVVVTLGMLVLVLGPYAGLALLPGAGAAGYLAALVFLHACYALLGRQTGCGWQVFPLMPVAALGMLFTMWRSAILTLRQGGVRWRDTFYPLDLLRANVYR